MSILKSKLLKLNRKVLIEIIKGLISGNMVTRPDLDDDESIGVGIKYRFWNIACKLNKDITLDEVHAVLLEQILTKNSYSHELDEDD